MIPHAPILAIVVPLLGGFLTPVISIISEKLNKKEIRSVFVLGLLSIQVLLVLNFSAQVWQNGTVIYEVAGRTPPLGINLTIDNLGVLAALIVSAIGYLVAIYSFFFMSPKEGQGKYYTLLFLLIAGMMGVSLTGDIFNFYVFFEIMSICSYALVSFYRDRKAIEASFKYLVMGTIGTSFLLLGIALLYGLTGTLNIADIARRLIILEGELGKTSFVTIASMGLFITGLGIKIGMVPLHAWLPDSYQSAPSSISSIMAGGTAVAGVYALVRIVFMLFANLSIGTIFVGLGLVSMIVGALLALVQKDIKRLLAYSGISQMGYILLGIGLGATAPEAAAEIGIQGGLFHMLNNAIYKSLLFLCAGAIVYRYGTSKMEELGGIGNKMPVTTIAFVIGALALSGIPPFNGFASKWIIYMSGIESGYPYLTVIAVIVSALTLAYLLKAIGSIFLGQTKDVEIQTKEVPIGMLIPMIILASLCIILGIFPQLGMDVIEPAQSTLLNRLEYIEIVLGGI
ncbi:MAG: proton-conducting transporter membrane subunit [Candidatus Hadarchaeia archaeon]